MVKISIDYQGQLHCIAKHEPSGTKLDTDAPVDNNGRGESFSPTDLMATALGSCMATIMGIYAQRQSLDLTGLHIEVQKEMTTEAPRRIAKLTTEIWMPMAETAKHVSALKTAALACPVHHSLHSEIEKPIIWHWKE